MQYGFIIQFFDGVVVAGHAEVGGEVPRCESRGVGLAEQVGVELAVQGGLELAVRWGLVTSAADNRKYDDIFF